MTNTNMSDTKPLKVLIIEDEPLIAQDLSNLLVDWGYQVIGVAETFDEARQLTDAFEIDLALVDVQIKGEKDGIETVRALNAGKRFPVIYLTAQADTETIQRAKDTSPSAYLLKPFDERTLHISIDLAFHNYVCQLQADDLGQLQRAPKVSAPKLNAESMLIKGDEVFIKQNYKFVRFKIQEIVYLEADRNHTLILTKSQKAVVRMALANVVEKMNCPFLIRIHRSYAINIHLVEEFDDTEVVVNKKAIPLSPNYRTDFLNQFNVV